MGSLNGDGPGRPNVLTELPTETSEPTNGKPELSGLPDTSINGSGLAPSQLPSPPERESKRRLRLLTPKPKDTNKNTTEELPTSKDTRERSLTNKNTPEEFPTSKDTTRDKIQTKILENLQIEIYS